MRLRHALLASAAGALAACRAPMNFMAPAGPAARRLSELGWSALILFSIVIVVMWLLVLAVAMRRRGTLAEHDLSEAPGGRQWIFIGGFAVPALILSALFIAMLHSLRAFPMENVKCEVPTIRVLGHQWWFETQYETPGQPALNVSVPTEIHIPVGQPVNLELATADVIHSFWIPKLHGKVDLVPGEKNHLRILADAPGVYQGQCAEYCGLHHANMRMQVVAQAPADFTAWLARQRADAALPADAIARRGREVFETQACAVCHRVRGTPAQGTVGPDLTHVASRATIAGGAFPNDTAHLEAWVTQAQSLKPGAQMPNLAVFEGADLRALVAYLQQLQ